MDSETESTRRVQIYASVSPEFKESLQRAADRVHVPLSAYVAMCVSEGFRLTKGGALPPDAERRKGEAQK